MPGNITNQEDPAHTSESAGGTAKVSSGRPKSSKKSIKCMDKISAKERDENTSLPLKRLYDHTAKASSQPVTAVSRQLDAFTEAEAHALARLVNGEDIVPVDMQNKFHSPENDTPAKDDAIAKGLLEKQHKTQEDDSEQNVSEQGNNQAPPERRKRKAEYASDSKTPNNPDAQKEKKYVNSGLDGEKRPISEPKDIFEDMTLKAYNLGLNKAIQCIRQRKLKVATMCSGTESPILALRLIIEALKCQDLPSFEIEHLFSCEIEPFKQSYIQRNFNPPILFRDVTELQNEKATNVYGAKLDVPGDVDVLIAGCSCVDYSLLNSFRKGFHQDGESKETREGVLAYAKEYRPKIVILENVKGAPWSATEEAWHEIGYETQVALVDSKDFYIPQTRERGYMIALDCASSPNALKGKSACSGWLETMKNLVRRASSPFTDFIFQDGDPRLQVALREMMLSQLYEKPNGQRGWEKCRQRYLNTRAAYSLGFQRPFTGWQNNGTCQVPDYAWQSWFKNQRERIWDTLDINHLRYIGWRDYHLPYKSRFIDLSQNTDYEADKRAWGVIGCLTPSGMPFFTIRGGPVTGRESLALQGIPIDQLSLTRESSRQLQDLAGNAMTSTVVGATIISALTVAFQMLEMGIAEPELNGRNDKVPRDVTHDTSTPVDNQNWPLQQIGFEQEVAHDVPFDELKQLACSTLQLCACEGLATDGAQNFQECRDCGHTSCTTCGGKPLHNYRSLPGSATQKRADPSGFEQKLTACLPARLHVADLDSTPLISRLSGEFKDNAAFKDHLQSAFEAELHLAKIRRGSVWAVAYESQYSRLMLIFRRDLSVSWLSAIESKTTCSGIIVEWSLYAKPQSTAPGNSAQRSLLAQPIARMTCKSSLLDGPWEVSEPCETTFLITTKGSGQLVDSWERKQGLQDAMFVERQVWSEISISYPEPEQTTSPNTLPDIFGKYQLLQNCDTACGSLHKKIQADTEEEPIFFFLDPYHLGNAINDTFVFANTHTRLSPAQDRKVIAKIDGPWRPDAERSRDISCVLTRKWQPCQVAKIRSMALELQVKRWLPTSLEGVVVTQDNCKGANPVMLRMEMPLAMFDSQLWRSGKVIGLDVTQAHAVPEVASLVQKASLPLASDQWRRICSHNLQSRCTSCAPKVPSLEWLEVVSTKKTGREITTIKPFEKPEEAHEYEMKVKDRPHPVTGQLRQGEYNATLTIEMNVATLVHQMQSKLLGNQTDLSKMCEIFYRLVADHGYDQMEPFPRMTLLSNETDESSQQPANFNMSLWPRQLKALTWMIQQEAWSYWQEAETEEIRLAYTRIRLEVLVTIPRTIRGGVLADEVGFGKTATVLGLIDVQASGANATTRQESGFVMGEPTIRLKATVIFVPVNLMVQWRAEIEKYLGGKYEVLVIPNSSYLTENVFTFKRFLAADIILTNWNVFDGSYFENMRALVDAPDVPNDSGRAFKEWSEQMLGELGTLVETSNGCKPDAFWSAKESRKENNAACRRFEGLSKRKKPEDYKSKKRQHEKSDTGASQKRQKADDMSFKPDRNQIRLSPLLHMFSFDRLVLDEFTYAFGKPRAAISTLKAERKWILSGTPPLGSLEDVNSMAKLLGTKIGEDDDLGFVFQEKKALEDKAKNKTLSEIFQSFEKRRSPAWYAEKVRRAQEFIHTFVRQNPSMLVTIKQETHLEVIKLSAAERATYFQLFQHLMIKNVQFNGEKQKTSRPSKRTRREQMLAMINTSDSPEDALLTCCSMLAMELKDETKKFQRGSAVCDAIVAEKNAEICKTMKDLYPKIDALFGHHKAWLHPTAEQSPYFYIYLRCIEKNRYGDSTFTRLMESVLFRADNNTTVVLRGGTRNRSDHKIEQMRRLPKITSGSLDLVEQIRGRRFFNMIQLALKKEPLPPCSCCRKIIPDPSQVLIMGLCGHVSCTSCYHDSSRKRAFADQCVDVNCSAAAPKHSAILASDFGQDDPTAVDETTYGSKLDAVMDLLKDTNRIAADERVLIFVQTDRLRLALVQALKAKTYIQFADASKPRWEDTMTEDEMKAARQDRSKLGRATTSAVIERFKVKKAGQVCILKIDSADAAGWNLPVANHVIFLSTLVTRSQQQYDATMTQAIGRARRWGQKKVVHVYHFVAANTIDVNLLQGREHKTLVKRGAKYLLVDKEEVLSTDQAGWEGAPFQGAASGTGDLEVDLDGDLMDKNEGDD